MQKSALEQSSNKKRGEHAFPNNNGLSPNKTFNNYTEIMISTNNKEVPFISIYKPDSIKQQHKVQAITIMYEWLKRCEIIKLQHTFTRIMFIKHHQKQFASKCLLLRHSINKIEKKKLLCAFVRIVSYRMKKKEIFMALRMIDRLNVSLKVNNSRFAINKLKLNNYQSIIHELKNGNQMVKNIEILQSQLNSLKLLSFSQSFTGKLKIFQKANINIFIENLRKNDIQNLLKVEQKKYQEIRAKKIPKRRDLLQNESMLLFIANIIKAYEYIIEQRASIEEQLQQKIEKLSSSQEINKLNDIIHEKTKTINQIEIYTNEMVRFDNQIKRYITQVINYNSIETVINSQQKKLEVRCKKSQGAIKKIIDSRLTLLSFLGKFSKSLRNQQQPSTLEQASFILDQGGNESLSSRFFAALKQTLQTTSLSPNLKEAILQYEEDFQKIINDNEEMQEKKSSESLMEEITAISVISNQLKKENQNLKVFERIYQQLIFKNSQNQAIIKELTQSNKQLSKIHDLEAKVSELSFINNDLTEKLNLLTNPNSKQSHQLLLSTKISQFQDKSCSRFKSKGDLCSQKETQLIKQNLRLKIYFQTLTMSHDKEVRQLRDQIYTYQTNINQLQAQIIRKEHRNAKEEAIINELKGKIAQSKIQRKKKYDFSKLYIGADQKIQGKQEKQGKQDVIQQLNEAKHINETLILQMSQAKRQSYKRQKCLEEKIANKQKQFNTLKRQIQQLSHYSHTKTIPQKTLNKQEENLCENQVEFLSAKVKSLQVLLNQIISHYHELQSQFHQEGQHVQKIPLITTLYEQKHVKYSKVTGGKQPTRVSSDDQPIFIDDKQLSHKLMQLMASNESLAYSIDYFQQSVDHNRKDLFETQWIIELIFSILLDVSKLNANQGQGINIWKELWNLKTLYGSKALIVNLQIYCKEFISRIIQK